MTDGDGGGKAAMPLFDNENTVPDLARIFGDDSGSSEADVPAAAVSEVMPEQETAPEQTGQTAFEEPEFAAECEKAENVPESGVAEKTAEAVQRVPAPAAAPVRSAVRIPVRKVPQKVYSGAEKVQLPELPAVYSDPAASAKIGFAGVFRELREHCGFDFHRLAELTNIRETYLRAIEAEDFETLPPVIYVIAYLRQLGKFYGLEAEVSDALTQDLRKTLSYEPPENVRRHIVVSEKSVENEQRLRKILWLIGGGAFLLLVLAGGGVYFLLKHLDDDASAASAVPAVGQAEISAMIGGTNLHPVQIRQGK